MSKRMIGAFAVVVLATFIAVPLAFSQMDQPQRVYTFVSQFQVPRANWAQYAEDTDKTAVPIMEKMMADGTILSWSTFEHIVHTPEGYTHGAAFSSTTIAGLTKVLDEVRKAGPRPGQIASTKHEDFLMQSTTHQATSGHWTTGYLRVVCQQSKPENPDGYPAALKKYLGPTFDDQFKKGVITSYSIDLQYVITEAPSIRCGVFTYPNAESMDKWAGAINATLEKMSDADRAAFFGSTVTDSRRDIMARLTHYAHK
jgi:hypothetical protein